MVDFQTRVSFNNIVPCFIDPEHPVNIPPQYGDDSDNYIVNSNTLKQILKDKQRYGYGKHDGATDLNSGDYFSTVISQPKNKFKRQRFRLPPASRSILKNSACQIPIDHEYKDVYNEHDETKHDTSILGSNMAQGRRKSYAGMTDEEVLALDKQFAHASLDLDSFSFTSQLSKPSSYYQSASTSTKTTYGKTGYSREYPTRPVVSLGSYGLTMSHVGVDTPKPVERYPSVSVPESNAKKEISRYLQRVNASVLESTPRYRVILTVISGRKHTWSSLDYILRDLVQDNDHVVVVASLPVRESSNKAKINSSIENRNDKGLYQAPKSFDVDLEHTKAVCENIQRYCLETLRESHNPAKIRVSVELLNCKSSKQCLKDMYKLYQPVLTVLGIKEYTQSRQNSYVFGKKRTASVTSVLGPGLNGKYKVGDRSIMKFSSFAIEKSPVPVIYVKESSQEDTKNGIVFKQPFEDSKNDQSIEFANISALASDTYSTTPAISIDEDSLDKNVSPNSLFVQQLIKATEKGSYNTLQAISKRGSVLSENSEVTDYSGANISSSPGISRAVQFEFDDMSPNVYKVKSLLSGPITSSGSGANSTNEISRINTRLSINSDLDRRRSSTNLNAASSNALKPRSKSVGSSSSTASTKKAGFMKKLFGAKKK
ncbi:BA75_02289T0 [Komagataella pastoris]|uniref:BA75_02289T0 n=1 Tax=Komagataella pastoris TaxID=4922 RepID=A0A1B2JAT6_PICPA|nr:BA75_02289T0 [Komagataella pastoris]